MKKFLLGLAILGLLFVGCGTPSQESKDRRVVQEQQAQYAKRQPIKVFDWSLERHLVGELYNVRNMNVATHSVWRSDYGMIEGDRPSLGYGLPYDTSLTNPLQVTRQAVNSTSLAEYVSGVIEQAEPNGIFASKNTSATWIMAVGIGGVIEPIYTESKVTVYPYPVKVDYTNNRVTCAGKATVTITQKGRK